MAGLQYRDPTTKQFETITLGMPPIGTIAAWMGTAVPSGWMFCDGTAHGSAGLEQIIGSPNTPDLRGRFIVGVGPGFLPRVPGGEATVKITGAQSGIAAHGHTASTGGSNATHTHSFSHPNSPDHSHGSFYEASGRGHMDLSNPNDTILATDDSQPLDGDMGAHTHAYTSDPSPAHTHTVNVSSATAVSATEAHENMPPFYALAFIICTG